jgi:hypothetical protein
MTNNLYGKYTPPTSGGGKYLKIEDGQTVKVRILGYPVIFTKQFPGSENVSTRYAWVIFNQDTDEAQSFEQGITFFKKVQALSLDPDWGDTSGYDVKITRMGTGTETEYTVNPSPNSKPLTKEQLEKVATINLEAMHEGAIPFEEAVKGAKPTKPDAVVEEISDEPLDLSDIPF